jgi:hypothetical protein
MANPSYSHLYGPSVYISPETLREVRRKGSVGSRFAGFMYAAMWFVLGCMFLFVVVFSLYRNGVLLNFAKKYGFSQSYLSVERAFLGGPDWGRPSIEKPLPLVEFGDGTLPIKSTGVSSTANLAPQDVLAATPSVTLPSSQPAEKVAVSSRTADSPVAAIALPSAKVVEVASAKREVVPSPTPSVTKRVKTVTSTPDAPASVPKEPVAPAPVAKTPVAKAPTALPPPPVEQDANPLKAAIRSAIIKNETASKSAR